MKQVVQAQTKSCLTKSQSQNRTHVLIYLSWRLVIYEPENRVKANCATLKDEPNMAKTMIAKEQDIKLV